MFLQTSQREEGREGRMEERKEGEGGKEDGRREERLWRGKERETSLTRDLSNPQYFGVREDS